ncbi:hypothetical protein GJ496_003429 [Pomphorhynchus laevis]|nr:hypothetical protein GJ496_003429 [Pomphorhynchus laevis]
MTLKTKFAFNIADMNIIRNVKNYSARQRSWFNNPPTQSEILFSSTACFHSLPERIDSDVHWGGYLVLQCNISNPTECNNLQASLQLTWAVSSCYYQRPSKSRDNFSTALTKLNGHPDSDLLLINEDINVLDHYGCGSDYEEDQVVPHASLSLSSSSHCDKSYEFTNTDASLQSTESIWQRYCGDWWLENDSIYDNMIVHATDDDDDKGSQVAALSNDNVPVYGFSFNLCKQAIIVLFDVLGDESLSPKQRLLYDKRGLASNSKSSQFVQFVNKDNSYTYLHFHQNNDLCKFKEILQSWNSLSSKVVKKKGFSQKIDYTTINYKLHTFKFEKILKSDNLIEPLSYKQWKDLLDQPCNPNQRKIIRETLFYVGCDEHLYPDLLPFLLNIFPFGSSYQERKRILQDRITVYMNINKARLLLTDDKQMQEINALILKDVVRTDRCHPYYRGANNANISTLHKILANYVSAHLVVGYFQGMSDLLAPLLKTLRSEVIAYWCFYGLILRTIFVRVPNEDFFKYQLLCLQELLHLLVPDFYRYLKLQVDGGDLLFAHRWILLIFKREFNERDVLKIWITCFTDCHTSYFHIFIAAAICSIYGVELVSSLTKVNSNDILFHFASLSMQMNADLVLNVARKLLHKLLCQRRLPCVLYDIIDTHYIAVHPSVRSECRYVKKAFYCICADKNASSNTENNSSNTDTKEQSNLNNGRKCLYSVVT